MFDIMLLLPQQQSYCRALNRPTNYHRVDRYLTRVNKTPSSNWRAFCKQVIMGGATEKTGSMRSLMMSATTGDSDGSTHNDDIIALGPADSNEMGSASSASSASSSCCLDLLAAVAEQRQALKGLLQQTVSKLNSSIQLSQMDRDVLAELVQKLFFLNPNPNSATSQILNGRWVLLYTASGSDSHPFKGIEEMTGGGGVSLATPAAVTASPSDTSAAIHLEDISNTLSSAAALENTKSIMSKPGEVIQGSDQRGEHVVVLGDHDDAEPHVNNSTASSGSHPLLVISKLMSGVQQWSLMKSLSSLVSLKKVIRGAGDSAYLFCYKYLPVVVGTAVGKRRSSSLFGAVTSRGNFQEFDMSSNAVMNQAKFTAFGQECEFSLKGFIEPMMTNNMPAVSSAQTQYDEAGSGANADAYPVKSTFTGNIRVKATFTAGEICIGTGPEQKRVTLPVDWVRPSGYIDTPYLDDELRISVGGTGSIFIAVKLASKPTM